MTLLANSPSCHITGLYRHAVKGLSADELSKVTFTNAGETFPDDRRFALLQQKNEAKFNSETPEWLHKENFLCAFSAPQLMSNFLSSYQIVNPPADGSNAEPVQESSTDNDNAPQRLLTINDRDSEEKLLGPVDLATVSGRNALASFFSEKSGTNVVCATASSHQHKHQFGNTSGIKARKDTRTVHIVNAETVKCVAEKIGVPLNPTRFRPNVVLEGMEPWAEFDLVGQQIQIGDAKLSVIKQTVRCEGISVDPLDPENVLDIPKLLIKEFPQYGPFFGVYAVVDEPGTIKIGDAVVGPL
eukprot:CAMPEP_0119005136 /NCGR_PEP_ID=MMETSP1176-20130426/1546_1 /TAXON_ID=265551 /ORGANISM="Synedropsis recta cf, Strain CCMP1620" /LENGTH=299 /DNA_ID=CAMNT_0006956909 /DNA_START=20 /DNA_END=919 /DNA_ORIENTATION=+